MPLQLLSEALRSHLRSGVAITSLAQCVEELVLNGIDAGATCITVHVDTSHLFVKVIDNGRGMTKDDLQLVGQRYVTSKCHTLTDLNNLHCYGYRGEALASLASICSRVEIISQHRLSNLTYYKSIHHGQAFPVVTSNHQLSRPGTTIILNDIFHSLPVRMKILQPEAMELNKIRRSLAAICLIHPNISFSLYNLQTTKCLLQTLTTSSILKTFSCLFGRDLIPHFKEVGHNYSCFHVSGYVSTESYHNKALQFIYVNKRLVCKTQLHSRVNSILNNSLVITRKMNRRGTETKTASMSMSPRLSGDKYGVYILNIECPLSEYDICIEPAKTLVEFREWDRVLTAIDNTMKSFLSQHHLSLGISDKLTTSLDLMGRTTNNSFLESSEPTTASMKIGLQSASVKRSPLAVLSSSSLVNNITNTSDITEVPSSSAIIPQKRKSKIGEKLLKSKLKKLSKVESDDNDLHNVSLPFPTTAVLPDVNQCTGPSIDHRSPQATNEDKSIVLLSNDNPNDQGISYQSSNSLHHHNVPKQSAETVQQRFQAEGTNNKDWLITNDIVTGSKLYINIATGNCQSTTPITSSTVSIQEELPTNISQSYGHQPLRAAPHLSYGYSPLCPRPKVDRLSFQPLASSSSSSQTSTALESIKESTARVSNKWREGSILSDWTNPAFSGGHSDILNIGTTSRQVSSQIKVHGMIHSHTFSPSMLTTAKVLGQVDNKFIACLLTSELKGDLLVLFDQHAVHERIRLESLTKELYDCNTGDIKSVTLDCPIVLLLDQTYRDLVMTFTKQIQSIGMKLSCKGRDVLLTCIPSIVMEAATTLAQNKDGETPSLEKLCRDLIVKHIELLQSVGKVSSILPPSIQQILNSKACHGAIKFGDPLSLEQCSDMIRSLSKCQLPFQCAHGRPSLVPIVDLPLLEKRFPTNKTTLSTTNKLNFSKLLCNKTK